MKSWPSPALPAVPTLPSSLQAWDTPAGATVTITADQTAGLYVCGITPYDATHIGHANTYVQFDLLIRYWLSAGLEVTYTQNVTDIDDPLLERAEAIEVDWQQLAAEQTDLFREDMEALRVIPPENFVGAVDSIPQVVTAVEHLLRHKIAYAVQAPDAVSGSDYYFDIAAAERATDWRLGSIGNYSRQLMEELFPERGGDPERAGKRDPLDPLLWRARRDAEPYWDGGTLGQGRPGWHIECSVIARNTLPAPFTVQGGGSDLRFPHHEFSAAHATAADGVPLAQHFMHTGMVGLDGEKMSKSKGNLVLVSRLRAQGTDPQAIRVLLLSHQWAEDWDFTHDDLAAAQQRLAGWKAALAQAPSADTTKAEPSPDEPDSLLYALHSALANSLNAPAALELLDQWAAGQLAPEVGAARVADVVDALLGIDLR